ncbi:MAG TPA: hypothetical protein VK582_22510 [Pyrinomonadaceae bacterium]|nr:hypothetical protein [Pyrinomonadaceae bacterium]
MAADKSRALRAILPGGLIAGSLDISYACIYSYLMRRTSPVRILQSVASGVLGASAFTGGNKTAAVGLAFHFLIATIAAAVYYLASRPLRLLVNQASICGVLYGVCVYLFMNFVVLPLSAIPFKMSYPWPALIGGLLIHMFGIGLPIALVTRKYSK